MSGQLVTFEGIDGAGKSTHVAWCLRSLDRVNWKAR